MSTGTSAKGVPEVIYAPRKRDADLEAIVRHFLADRGSASGQPPGAGSGRAAACSGALRLRPAASALS